jgi:hypothetical protein
MTLMGGCDICTTEPVMPGLIPGIHVFLLREKGVDGRNKSGHDA